MRNFFLLANLCALFCLTSCASPTKNVSDNTMYFGTNTTIGVYVDKNLSGKTPKVVFGYTRDEKVILPLVATGADSSSCAQREGAKPSPTCFFVGQRDNKIVDSYSVLASFGGRTGSNTDEKGNKVEGAIAQYFSTGVASQLLAANGGAAIVSIGTSTTAAVSNPQNAAAAAAVVAPESVEIISYNNSIIVGKEAAKRRDKDAQLVSECLKNPAKNDAFKSDFKSNTKTKEFATNVEKFSYDNVDSLSRLFGEEMAGDGYNELMKLYEKNCK